MTECFHDTLEDLIKKRFIFTEKLIWSLLINMMNVLYWESVEKEENLLFHPKTIVYLN